MKRNNINYNDFVNARRIIHNENIKTLTEGLKFLSGNKGIADIISYEKFDSYLLFQAGIIHTDDSGNYFYDFLPKREGDIIDNISFEFTHDNINVSFIIGGQKYEQCDVTEFIYCLAQYQDLKVRVTFLEKPKGDDEFKIYRKIYLLNIKDKIMLNHSNQVITDKIIYKNGMCIKKNNKT